MKLDAETNALIQKRLRQNLGFLEISGCAVLSTGTFSVVYLCRCSEIRHTMAAVAFLGVLLVAGAGVLAMANATIRYRVRNPARTWLVATVSLWAGFATGFVVGDYYWNADTAKYYAYKEMASYVDVNPSVDKATSYMDAGVIYFKEGTSVLRSMALAFRNGRTYCVAPIYLDPLQNVSNTASSKTPGFITPRSGTIDFWAVGVDCCGDTGNTFTCGEAGIATARTGMRVLEDKSTLMYQLAVQEWSASTGLPSKHPMFLEWVTDPISVEESMLNTSINNFWRNAVGYFFASLIASYMLHMTLRHWKFV
ncbi:unnamed protein product [Polarella glacialis]|uniref:Uncharacterized protein n=1 Tax=Polarella glacialis TaxID=89957 RepID=A0A813FG37_POLGL|nr:unnamed protein product [Polarella glacialis]|mmetsp:Transcript_7082/g.11247  ORF Transcript_7082/g.11247 Transcript_7082/m.11247 type:complete len:309 (-) Transcript_7082:162-1088(-)